MAAYYWIDSEYIAGKISYKALIAEIGKPAAKSAVGKLRYVGGNKQLIPSYENLEIGDIILSGYPKKENGKDRWHPVHQSQIRHGCNAASCRWTHAMLYVGELHVIESNKPTKLKTGVEVDPGYRTSC